MKNKVYAFGKFYDPAKVQVAIRALLMAGIPRAQIRVLSPSPHNDRSNVNSKEQKHFAFIGLFAGFLFGLIGATILFIIPSMIFDYAYKYELAAVGTVFSVLAGASAAQLISLGSSRRRSGDHLIGPNEHGVMVTIHEGQEEQLNRAKDEFDRLDYANA
ncbi:MAG: hypothetical protein HC883_02250 [Bdellovibrionaceae bacterium]|nr:hypothetical protein [Pseudobdellovibrionaceae bacterium]